MDKFELQKLRDLPIEGVAERLGLNVVTRRPSCLALVPREQEHLPMLRLRSLGRNYRLGDEVFEQAVPRCMPLAHGRFMVNG